MTPYRRNVMVGATVVVALALLGWMILKFSGDVSKIFAQPTIGVSFVADRADGVAEGSPITYRGIEVGRVSGVVLDENKTQVKFNGAINAKPTLPKNLLARIRTASALGTGSMVTLDIADKIPSPEPLAEGQIIPATYIGLGELLPTAQIGDLATELAATVKQVRETKLIEHINEQVVNAGRVIDSVQKLIGDEKSREDLKASLANIRAASESAKTIAANFEKVSVEMQKTTSDAGQTITEVRAQVSRTGNNIETLSRQMGDRLTQIAKLMEQMQSIAEKVDKGEGTAGRLVNDTRLYESLVDTSKELNATIKDFKRLVEQWEQEGVSLKLK